MKKNNLFWGIFFILAAVLLIVSRFDFFSDLSLFRLLLALLLGSWFLHSLTRHDFGGMLFSIAFLCILYDEFLHIENLTPWPVLGSALLGSIGLSMIFKKPYEVTYGATYAERPKQTSPKEDFHGNNFNFSNCFGSCEKHIHSDNFTKAFIRNSCGKTVVYFDDAIIQQGSAQIVLDVNFASTQLYIPKTWNVINHASATFGSILEKNTPCNNSAPTLTITGNVFCGSVSIYYI